MTDESFGIAEIQRRLPHRYPFLLLDRVLAFQAGKSAVAIKNVSFNEFFFQGHFPGRPLMPGVLIIEAMAQLGGLLLMPENGPDSRLAVLAGIEKIRFRRMVQPGDQLILTAKLLKSHGNFGKIQSEAKVDDHLVTEGEFLFSLVKEHLS